MNEEAAFLRAIADAPEDPTPRLIYADWLDDQNDPRADLLRWDCELRRLPADDPRRDELLLQLQLRGSSVAAAWHAQVAHPTVINCFGTNGSDCPTHWHALEPTDDPIVRRCSLCQETVTCVAHRQDTLTELSHWKRVALDRDWVSWRTSSELLGLFMARLLGFDSVANSETEPLFDRLGGAFRHVMDAFLAMPRPVILPEAEIESESPRPTSTPDAPPSAE